MSLEKRTELQVTGLVKIHQELLSDLSDALVPCAKDGGRLWESRDELLRCDRFFGYLMYQNLLAQGRQ